MNKKNLLMKFHNLVKGKPTFLCIFVFLISSCFLFSCAGSSPPITSISPPVPLKSVETILSAGDAVDIQFTFWPEMNDTQTIRPDGKISLPMIDDVYVAGLTPEQLDTLLTERYDSKLKNPDITVIVRSLANQKIYVGGEVESPGLLELQGNLSVLQAVIYAGGFKETAKPEKTIVIRKGMDNHPTPIQLNLQNMLNGEKDVSGFQLQPSDVVYVPKSNIARANKFVNEYIERLLLFRGVGFSYDLNDDDND
jgi:protein involved in polysaccharide export with SLBB domain